MAELHEERGISFPFRISSKGGAAMSVANSNSVEKLVESMQQIVGISEGERCMEFNVYSEVRSLLFSSVDTDDTILSVCEYMVKDSINRLEPRVTVNDVVIKFDEDSNSIIAVVNFTVNNTGNTYNTSLGLGDING